MGEITQEKLVSESSVSLRKALPIWGKIAALSFGGPAGQIGVMHKVLVEERNWISDSRFLHALNYCMLLPGPEAQQLAIYIGWLLHGMRGGLLAGILFVLPGFLSILLFSIIYALYKNVPIVDGLFFGLKPAVIAIVLAAVIRIGKKALKTPVMVALSAVSFVALFFFNVPFPIIIISAALIGWIGGLLAPKQFAAATGHGSQGSQFDENDLISRRLRENSEANRPTLFGTLKTLGIFLFLWFFPLLLIGFFLGRENVFTQQGIFFSKASVITFGGAYAVLAYVAQQAVDHYGWLRPGEMLDGLGMAETTPGPLIQVVQFVGFMGAYRAYGEAGGGALSPLSAGVLASLLTTWVTFVPCFLWIFLGAPYIELLRENKNLNHALSSITAAVVGVVLNLALWFALHVVFTNVFEVKYGALDFSLPVWSTWNGKPLILSLLACFAIFVLKWSMMRTIGLSIVLGFLFYFLL